MNVRSKRSRNWVALATGLATMVALVLPLSGAALATHTADNSLDLQVAPEAADNPTGATHTLTAGLANCPADADAIPPEGCEVDFEIDGPGDTDGGNTPLTPDRTCFVPEGGTGFCQVSYSSSAEGVDTIYSWVDDDNDDATADGDLGTGGEGADESTTPGNRTEIDDTDVVTKNWFGALPANATLDCEPEFATAASTGPGNSASFTCTLYNDTDNDNVQDEGETGIAGVAIDGENRGNVNDPDNGAVATPADYNDFCTTDAAGMCTGSVSASEQQSGFTTICFWADNDADNQASGEGGANDGSDCGENVGATDDDTTDVVALNFAAPGEAAVLTLDPQSAQNPVGGTHTVTATVTDAFGTPVAGVNVDFDLLPGSRNDSGNLPFTAEPFCVDIITDANGEAPCTYTDVGGPVSGTEDADGIYAWADVTAENDADNSPNNDFNEPDDNAVKFWFDEIPAAATVTLDMQMDDNLPTTLGGGDAPVCPEGGFDSDATAANAPGSVHEVCAQADDANGDPIAGESVTFTLTGPDGATAYFTDATGANLGTTFTTNATAFGDAGAAVYAETAGTYTVTATADSASDSGTKTYTAPAASARNIVCEPETDTNAPGTQHLVTCTVTDRFGNPVPGVAVTFTESGPGRITSTNPDTTDANGQAEVVTETTEEEEGTQTITASLPTTPGAQNDACEQPADTPSPGSPAGNCQDEVTKEWTAVGEVECSDGIDNDGDGDIDFPADPGCESETDDDESGEVRTECNDNLDNDGDNQIDFPADDGCESEADDTEAGEKKKVDSDVSIKGSFKGKVTSAKAKCEKKRKVVLQKKKGGNWKKVGKDKTNNKGKWKINKDDPDGKYRAKAKKKKFTKDNGTIIVCKTAKSETVKR